VSAGPLGDRRVPMLSAAKRLPIPNPPILLVLLVAGLLTACGPASPSPSAPAAGPTPTVTVPVDLPVVIALRGQFRDQGLVALDQLIARFEAANPDVRVEVVDLGGNADQQRRRIANQLGSGDSSVDVYLVDDIWLGEFTSQGWLVSLDKYVTSYGVEPGGFLAPAVEANTIDAQLMALPWSADGGALYYRADLLDRYGIQPPADWAGLQRISLDLQDQEGVDYGLVWQGGAYESLTCNTLEFVWAYGGRVLDEEGKVVFDSAQTRAALEEMRNLVTSGVSPQDTATYDEVNSLDAFERGEAVFLRHWASSWVSLGDGDSPLAGRVGVAPLPVPCLVEQGLALSAFSRYPDQAFRLMAFLAGVEGQVAWALATDELPALEAAYHDADLLTLDPSLEALPEILSGARPRPQTPVYPAVSEAIYTEVNRMLAGEQDVETTAVQIQQRIEDAIGGP
jgi:multiple sugar transport system substrate-binding protein